VNDKIKLAKGITKFVVGASVSSTVIKLVKIHVPTVTRSEELQLIVGAWALGGMATERANVWADYKFDEVLKLVQSIKKSFDQEETTE